jgi:6-phosphogluconolactonase (cycloisomerase 2 family)
MRTSFGCWLSLSATVILGVCVATAVAATPGKAQFLVTNDDVPPPTPAVKVSTIYTVEADGTLTLKTQVSSDGFGTGGGYFPANRVVLFDNGSDQCIYASEALTGDVVGIAIPGAAVRYRAYGSSGDTGTSNGIGLALNGQYLYASYSDSGNIGTFQIRGGCSLTFIGDTPVLGLQGGIIDGMHVHDSIMVVTYGDGSIESFDISAGTPVSNGDEQNSNGSRGGATYPSDIDITEDGHYAIFGDTSTNTTIEVSDISSGKLTPTVVHRLSNSINSSNIMLSPDETLLYISNTQNGTITAAFFNKSTGDVTKGCISSVLKGYASSWSYVSGLALEGTTGTGGTIYVAEFPSSIAIVNVTSSGGTCTLTESANSPVSDPNTSGLLSIGTFPPRSF